MTIADLYDRAVALDAEDYELVLMVDEFREKAEGIFFSDEKECTVYGNINPN